MKPELKWPAAMRGKAREKWVGVGWWGVKRPWKSANGSVALGTTFLIFFTLSPFLFLSQKADGK